MWQADSAAQNIIHAIALGPTHVQLCHPCEPRRNRPYPQRHALGSDAQLLLGTVQRQPHLGPVDFARIAPAPAHVRDRAQQRSRVQLSKDEGEELLGEAGPAASCVRGDCAEHGN